MATRSVFTNRKLLKDSSVATSENWCAAASTRSHSPQAGRYALRPTFTCTCTCTYTYMYTRTSFLSQLFAFGAGACIGDGSCSATALAPRLIDELSTVRVIDVVCGDGHCVALTSGEHCAALVLYLVSRQCLGVFYLQRTSCTLGETTRWGSAVKATAKVRSAFPEGFHRWTVLPCIRYPQVSLDFHRILLRINRNFFSFLQAHRIRLPGHRFRLIGRSLLGIDRSASTCKKTRSPCFAASWR